MVTRKSLLTIASILGIVILCSCSKQETYADQKKKEYEAIERFISAKGINVIQEETFHQQGNVTNKNQFVYLNNSGVYMNISRQGAGTPLKNQENTPLCVRFLEINLSDTTKAVTNWFSPFDPDIMNVVRQGTTFTASFISGLMLTAYGASVPAGWLVPFNYINVGSPTETDISLVKLIVPHSQGHSISSGNVCPYYYEISFQRSPGNDTD